MTNNISTTAAAAVSAAGIPLEAPVAATSQTAAATATTALALLNATSGEAKVAHAGFELRKFGPGFICVPAVVQTAITAGVCPMPGSAGQPAVASTQAAEKEDRILELIGGFRLDPFGSAQILNSLITSYLSPEDYALFLTEILERRLHKKPMNRPDWEVSEEALEKEFEARLFESMGVQSKDPNADLYSEMQLKSEAAILPEIIKQEKRITAEHTAGRPYDLYHPYISLIPTQQEFIALVKRLVMHQIRAVFVKYNLETRDFKHLIALRMILLEAAIKKAADAASKEEPYSHPYSSKPAKQMFMDLLMLSYMDRNPSPFNPTAVLDHIRWDQKEYVVGKDTSTFYRLKPLEEMHVRFDEWVHTRLDPKLAPVSDTLVYRAALKHQKSLRQLKTSQNVAKTSSRVDWSCLSQSSASTFVIRQLTVPSALTIEPLWNQAQKRGIASLFDVLVKQAQSKKWETEFANCRTHLFGLVKEDLEKFAKENSATFLALPVNEGNLFFWLQEISKRQMMQYLAEVFPLEPNLDKHYKVISGNLAQCVRNKYPKANEDLNTRLHALLLVKWGIVLDVAIPIINGDDLFKQKLAEIIMGSMLWINTDSNTPLKRLLNSEISLDVWVVEYLSMKYPEGDEYRFSYSTSRFMKLVEMEYIAQQIIAGNLGPKTHKEK